MKVTIFGVGTVGGLVAARMAKGGLEPTLIARGKTLEAYRERGLVLRDRNGEASYRLPATDDTASLGIQDVVLIAAKAHSIPPAIDQIAALVGPDTVVVSMINGIPWWYFHGLAGDWPKRHLDTVDPVGVVWNAIGPEKAVGCVVYVATSMPEPGVVLHSSGVTFILGEPRSGEPQSGGPGGSANERLGTVAELLTAGGLKAPFSDDIRKDVWFKLWGNLSGNPMSALVEGDCGDIGLDDALVRIMSKMMEEAAEVAAAFGVEFAPDPDSLAKEIDERMMHFRNLTEAKTSMLQDFEAGKMLELDPILGSVAELGRMTGTATPTIDMIYDLTRRKAEIKGLYAPIAGSRTH
jgi:2-dehydropantoate 2-reductase